MATRPAVFDTSEGNVIPGIGEDAAFVFTKKIRWTPGDAADLESV